MFIAAYSETLLMRFPFLTSLAVIALPFLLHTSTVLAADTPCGTSAKDAIAAAEKSLASNDENSQALVLACLLAAVKDLNAHRSDAVRSDGTPIIRFPTVPNLPRPR